MRKMASLSWKFLCYADEEAFRLQSKHSDALYDYQMSMTFGLIWLAKKIIEDDGSKSREDIHTIWQDPAVTGSLPQSKEY